MMRLKLWIFCGLLFSTIASAKTNLEETFTNLPDSSLPITSSKTGKPLSKDEKAKLIKTVDKKNGYLEAIGNQDTDAFANAQMALFKKKDGSDLIGLTAHFGDKTNQIQFFLKEGETWKDVSKEVLPEITNEMLDKRAQDKIPSFKKQQKKLSDSASGTYAYILPKHGTTIDVVVSSDLYHGKRIVLWRLPFNGEKFTLKQ